MVKAPRTGPWHQIRPSGLIWRKNGTLCDTREEDGAPSTTRNQDEEAPRDVEHRDEDDEVEKKRGVSSDKSGAQRQGAYDDIGLFLPQDDKISGRSCHSIQAQSGVTNIRGNSGTKCEMNDNVQYTDSGSHSFDTTSDEDEDDDMFAGPVYSSILYSASTYGAEQDEGREDVDADADDASFLNQTMARYRYQKDHEKEVRILRAILDDSDELMRSLVDLEMDYEKYQPQDCDDKLALDRIDVEVLYKANGDDEAIAMKGTETGEEDSTSQISVASATTAEHSICRDRTTSTSSPSSLRRKRRVTNRNARYSTSAVDDNDDDAVSSIADDDFISLGDSIMTLERRGILGGRIPNFLGTALPVQLSRSILSLKERRSVIDRYEELIKSVQTNDHINDKGRNDSTSNRREENSIPSEWPSTVSRSQSKRMKKIVPNWNPAFSAIFRKKGKKIT